jgi:hypothetical protein
MKLDKKIKDRIDKYFNEISGLEFVSLLKHKYGFELELEVSEGMSFVNKSFESVEVDENYSNDSSNIIISNEDEFLCHIATAA